MSTRPATGSACGTSAKGGPHCTTSPTAALMSWQAAHQAAKLRRDLFSGAERQHRHTDLAGPREHAAQPRVGEFPKPLADVVLADIEHDLQLTVGDGHTRRRRQ